MKCPDCNFKNAPRSKYCGSCGYKFIKSEKIDESKTTVNLPDGDTAYFSISVFKFLAMSCCTFGLYNFYWHYKNWSLIQKRDQSDISPFWRAVFRNIFCYFLFEEIGHSAKKLKLNMPGAPGLWAAAVIVTTVIGNFITINRLFWKIPIAHIYSIFVAVPIFFHLPMQGLANDVNRVLNPGHAMNSKFRGWNIAALVVGGILFFLTVVSIFNGDSPAVKWETYGYDEFHFSIDSPYPLVSQVMPMTAETRKKLIRNMVVRTEMNTQSKFSVMVSAAEASRVIQTRLTDFAESSLSGVKLISTNFEYDLKKGDCSGYPAIYASGKGVRLLTKFNFLALFVIKGQWAYSAIIQYPDDDQSTEEMAQKMLHSLDIKLNNVMFELGENTQSPEVDLKTLGRKLDEMKYMLGRKK